MTVKSLSNDGILLRYFSPTSVRSNEPDLVAGLSHSNSANHNRVENAFSDAELVMCIDVAVLVQDLRHKKTQKCVPRVIMPPKERWLDARIFGQPFLRWWTRLPKEVDCTNASALLEREKFKNCLSSMEVHFLGNTTWRLSKIPSLRSAMNVDIGSLHCKFLFLYSSNLILDETQWIQK